MKYQQLGKSDLQISRIGFGSMSLSATRKNESISLLHAALAAGINYFDTADLYEKGLNEEMLGEAFEGKRDQVILATKVGNQWRADGPGWDWNPSKAYILKSVEESLRRLRTDYIDLYQLHGGTIDDPLDDAIEAFESLQQQGKIRYYGISSIRPNVIREYVQRSRIVSVMMQYSLADRRPEESVLDLLKDNNIGVLARGALAQGMLIDKPAKDYLGHTADAITAAAQLLQGIQLSNQTSAQSAIRYVLQHPAITAAVVGIRTMAQLKEMIATPDKQNLSVEDRRMLEEVLPAFYYEQHR
jgi:aryl-alcohol dehydrogenase-like predicted oxidoreductase